MEDLQLILQEAQKNISAAKDAHSLDQIKARYLGKKSELTDYLKNLGQMSPEERPRFGQAVNAAKNQLQEWIQVRAQEINEKELAAALASQTVDVTLTGRGQVPGNLHPVTLTTQRFVSYFTQLGFEVVEGPEIEDDYHNFTALNIPENHPARAAHDTFYFPGGLLLRTHTSPVQIRTMKNKKPPIRIIAPGRTYRCDSDLRHTPMFHQVEVLMIDETTNFANLKSILSEFIKYFFEQDLAVRFRPSYFPFTEPSAEVDMQCANCQGKGCRVCSHTGWLEILGSGMVHPNVLANVGIDSEKYSGFAFGLGLERLAMLYYKIDDMRMLFDNDVRFLQQF